MPSRVPPIAAPPEGDGMPEPEESVGIAEPKMTGSGSPVQVKRSR